jgi:phosphatidylglycerophosphate synthase
MTELSRWILGDLTPSARILTALLPALVASAYFLVGLLVYAVRCARWGPPRQFERDARGRSALVGYHARLYFFWIIDPLWRLLLRSGLSANQVSALAWLSGVGAAVASAFGRFALGGWLFLLSGTLDALDGRLARARNQASPVGAAIDSILDRYIDALMLIGLGIYYLGGWPLIPVMLALMGSLLVPYVRAKSEALGFPVRGGLMQRTERILYLGGTVALSPIFEAIFFPEQRHPVHRLALAGILLLAVTTNITAVARFATLVRAIRGASAPDALSGAPAAPAPAGGSPAATRGGPSGR